VIPAPCLDDSLACTTTSPNIVLPDEDRFNLLDIPLAGDSTRELSDCPSHRDPLTYDRHTDESSPILSQACYHSESSAQTLDYDREGKPVTVHEFLQDTTSKVGRKYGRKNRLATVELGAYYPTSSGDRSPAPSTTPCHLKVEIRNDQRVSAPTAHLRKPSRRIARRAPHPRRKRPFAKSLAQRLFEADVFSSGTTPSHPVDASVRNPAHTSARRPLQFVTSLNLIPSLESRIRNRRKGAQEDARDGSGSPAAQASPEELLGVSDSARGASPNRLAAAAATSGHHHSSSRNRNKATTQRARTGGFAAVLASGRRAQTFRTRVRGGKHSTTRLAPKPFEYVPLPLVWVKNAAT